MIYLHTGQPGAGKTLNTLVEVQKRALKEKRTVYYSGINQCRVPGWIEFGGPSVDPENPHWTDPSNWFELPHKAIIVIDEAQRLYRPRHYGSVVPAFVAKLETHRHHGWDLHLVTQDPRLLDTNVRRLVGRHIHYVRAFGAKAVTRHEWMEVREDIQKRDDSTSQLVPYNKEAFAWYKSAEAHTHKIRLPGRIWLLVALPLVIGAFVWYAGSSLTARLKGKDGKEPAEVSKKDGERAAAVPAGGQPGAAAVLTPAQYVARYVPRVPGLPHTAPVYDSITQPKEAPRPAACVSNAKRCDCFTQQGTRLDVKDDLCRSIVERGFFQEWHDQESPNGAVRAEARPSTVPTWNVGGSPSRPEQSRAEAVQDIAPPARGTFIKSQGYERASAPIASQAN